MNNTTTANLFVAYQHAKDKDGVNSWISWVTSTLPVIMTTRWWRNSKYFICHNCAAQEFGSSVWHVSGASRPLSFV